MKKFYIISGGTVVHVAPHFALCAPAYGSVGTLINHTFRQIRLQDRDHFNYEFHDVKTNLDNAIVGRGIQYILNIAPNNDFFALQIFYPKDLSRSITNPERMLNKKNIMIGGIFALEKQYDEKYIFVPLDFAQDLFDYGNRRTSLEITTDDARSDREVQADLKELLGPGPSPGPWPRRNPRCRPAQPR